MSAGEIVDSHWWRFEAEIGWQRPKIAGPGPCTFLVPISSPLLHNNKKNAMLGAGNGAYKVAFSNFMLYISQS